MQASQIALGLMLLAGGSLSFAAQVEPRPLANAALTLRQAPPVVLLRCYEWWTGKKVIVPKEFETLTKPMAVSFEGLTQSQAAERVAEILQTQVGIEIVPGPDGAMLARRIGAGNVTASAGVPGRAMEFIGFLTSNDTRYFTIRDLDSGLVSPWLKLGQAWRGHTLETYEPKTERLTVIKAGVPIALSLASKPANETGILRSLDTLLDKSPRSIRDLPTDQERPRR